MNKILIILLLSRLILAYIFLFKSNISLYLKILFIIFIDTFDCGLPNCLGQQKNKTYIDCFSNEYQIGDKIVDTFSYIMLLYFIINYSKFKKNNINLLIFLLFLRIIGVVLYLIKNNRKFLFYFPNFFLEISLGFSLINKFEILNKNKNLVFMFILFYKLTQEYLIHVYKINFKNNIENLSKKIFSKIEMERK